jgi:hypothetical protein
VPVIPCGDDDEMNSEGENICVRRNAIDLTRRDLIKGSAAVAVLGATSRLSRAAEDPLPSWNDGPAKAAVLAFVRDTTDKSSSKYVEPADRIATFDQDGTLWTEHPLYGQAAFALARG